MANLAHNIDNLPQEILDLLHFASRQAISNLSRTCKLMHNRVIHALYGTIDLTWIGSGPRENGLKKPKMISSPSIKFLVRTLLEDSALANLVTQLSFRTVGFWWPGTASNLETRLQRQVSLRDFVVTNEPYERHLYKAFSDLQNTIISEEAQQESEFEIVESLKQILEEQDLRIHEYWKFGIATLDVCVYVCLLIWLCRNLKSIHLDGPSLKDNYELEETMLRGGRFKDLKSITFGERHRQLDDFLWPPRSDLSCYVEMLPTSLETLGLPHATIQPNHSWQPLGTDFSKLTTLMLPVSAIFPYQLAAFLRSLPALKNLDYGISFDIWTTSTLYKDCELNAQALQSALNLVKETLTQLRFHRGIRTWKVERDSTSEYLLRHYSRQICSLHDFPSLTSAHISLDVLYGWFGPEQDLRNIDILGFWRMLPASMEQLTIHCDFMLFRLLYSSPYCYWLSFFTRAFKSHEWRDRVPRLRRLDFDTFNGRLELSDDEKTGLIKLCEDNGLLCDFVDTDVEWAAM